MSAERFLVASILAAPSTIHLVRERISADAIRDPELRGVYASALELAESGTLPSATALASAKRYDLERLYALQMSVDDARDAEQLAELVADSYLARRVSSALAALAVDASTVEPHQARELVGQAISQLVELSMQAGVAGHMVSLADATADAVRTVRDRFERRSRGEPAPGYTTGLDGLNRRLGNGGLMPGRCLYVGAGPGTGKTALALHIIKAAAAQHPNTAHVYVTGETWAAELAQRHLASGASIPLHHLDASANATMFDVGAKLSAWIHGPNARPANVLIRDKPRPTVGDILSSVHAARARFPTVGVVIVDHLHLMGHRDGENDERAIRATVEGLHAIAHRERVALVVLAQCNRSRKDSRGAPPMSAIRGSGAVEEFAHAVLMLGVEDDQTRDADPLAIEALLDKNRSGPVGNCLLMFHRAHQRFAEVQR